MVLAQNESNGWYNFSIFPDPKKRQIWLKIWFDKLEAAELINSSFFEVMEEDEDDLDDDDDNFYNSRNYSTNSSWSDSSSIGSCN